MGCVDGQRLASVPDHPHPPTTCCQGRNFGSPGGHNGIEGTSGSPGGNWGADQAHIVMLSTRACQTSIKVFYLEEKYIRITERAPSLASVV